MSALVIARAHWEQLPDWVKILADECDLTSQNQVAKRLGYSASVVSNVLRNTYAGSMSAVEDTVRGALMAEEISCLGLGTINRRNCRDWRKKSRAANPPPGFAVTMFRACNRCPVNKGASEDE